MDNSKKSLWEYDDCKWAVIEDDNVSRSIVFFDDIVIDEKGFEYKGERIDDAGKIYQAMWKMLTDHGYKM